MSPPELVVVADEVPGASDTLATEGVQAGRRHPPHGAAF